MTASTNQTVNYSLTPEGRSHWSRSEGRRTREHRVENDDYAAFARRVIAAHGRRIADGDLDNLTTLAALADTIDDAILTAVQGLRAHGYSWAQIARQLGITRQAAQQRWGAAS